MVRMVEGGGHQVESSKDLGECRNLADRAQGPDSRRGVHGSQVARFLIRDAEGRGSDCAY